MAFSPVSPSMILASSSSPTAWCLSHCLSLPFACNKKDALIHSVTWIRQFKAYQAQHTDGASLQCCDSLAWVNEIWTHYHSCLALFLGRKEIMLKRKWSLCNFVFLGCFAHGTWTVGCRNVELFSCKCAGNLCKKPGEKNRQPQGHARLFVTCSPPKQWQTQFYRITESQNQ